MEEYALGYMINGQENILGDESKTENTKAKESPELKAVKEMMGKGLVGKENKWSDPWLPLMLLLILGGPKSNNEADYWRGRYDALKEALEAEKAKQ